MKAVISSDFNDIYLFNIPIVAWAWKKLDVEVIWFQKSPKEHIFQSAIDMGNALRKLDLISYTRLVQKIEIHRHFFDCPPEKAATYAQVSRLYACCLDLPEDEILVTSDADMMVFKNPVSPYLKYNRFNILGYDLVPPKQYPICYVQAPALLWREFFTGWNKNYQELLDELLGDINCENFRGNYWGKDQETLYAKAPTGYLLNAVPRARPGTQFAENRLDRDDAFILDRLSPDIVDYHMHRPLWEEANFNKLLTIMKYFWPDEDLTWVKTYRDEYVKLL